jgi:hypothetical protein
MPDPLVIAVGTTPLGILPHFANRHGLIAGATGTGKTVTLQVIAEAFSRIGVPVFAADVKGDLSGSSSVTSPSPPARSASGTSSANRGIRCAPPCGFESRPEANSPPGTRQTALDCRLSSPALSSVSEGTGLLISSEF